ncbi:hypothetical protein TYRP_006325 [Tyrophagus putrescentiae]|nr:hypothetical protein TYRP_006325 [Tyrophagus putrescentiae]
MPPTERIKGGKSREDADKKNEGGNQQRAASAGVPLGRGDGDGGAAVADLQQTLELAVASKVLGVQDDAVHQDGLVGHRQAGQGGGHAEGGRAPG